MSVCFYCFDFSLVLQQKHTREYGKIFKSHFGPQFVVSVADRESWWLRCSARRASQSNMGSSRSTETCGADPLASA